MSNDPYDFNAPMAPLTEDELREIHEDPAFLAWVDERHPDVREPVVQEREAA